MPTHLCQPDRSPLAPALPQGPGPGHTGAAAGSHPTAATRSPGLGWGREAAHRPCAPQLPTPMPAQLEDTAPPAPARRNRSCPSCRAGRETEAGPGAPPRLAPPHRGEGVPRAAPTCAAAGPAPRGEMRRGAQEGPVPPSGPPGPLCTGASARLAGVNPPRPGPARAPSRAAAAPETNGRPRGSHPRTASSDVPPGRAGAGAGRAVLSPGVALRQEEAESQVPPLHVMHRSRPGLKGAPGPPRPKWAPGERSQMCQSHRTGCATSDSGPASSRDSGPGGRPGGRANVFHFAVTIFSPCPWQRLTVTVRRDLRPARPQKRAVPLPREAAPARRTSRTAGVPGPCPFTLGSIHWFLGLVSGPAGTVQHALLGVPTWRMEQVVTQLLYCACLGSPAPQGTASVRNTQAYSQQRVNPQPQSFLRPRGAGCCHLCTTLFSPCSSPLLEDQLLGQALI